VVVAPDPRIDLDAAGLDAEVVIAATKAQATQLGHLHASTLRPVFQRHMLERDDAMRQTVQLEIALGSGLVVKQEHGALPSGEIVLEGQNLPAKPQWIASEQPHLGQGVEYDQRGIGAVHRREHRIDRLLKLYLGWMKDRVILLPLSGIGIGELEDIDIVQIPAMRARDIPQLGLRLR
jgi:hypothetical protein